MITSLGFAISSFDLGGLLDFKHVSLDDVLDASIAGLNLLVGKNNEVQVVSHNASSGSFRLHFDGDMTDPMDVATTTAEDIALALQNMSGLPNHPDGIQVRVSGGGTTDDPWVIEFLSPEHVDVTQQIEGVGETDFANENGDAAFITLTRVDGGIDPNSLVKRRLPIVDKSLTDILGSSTTTVIEDIAAALETFRSTLLDMKAFEINVNFELNEQLGLGLELGAKQSLLDAAHRLRSVAHGLDGDSSDSDIALEMAKSPELNALLSNLALLAASARLSNIDSSPGRLVV